MTIFEIDTEIKCLFDPETGALLDGAEERLSELSISRDEKVKHIALKYEALVREWKAIDEKAKQLSERAKKAKRNAENCGTLLTYATDGQDFSFPEVEVRFKKNPPTVVIENRADLVKWLKEAGHVDCISYKEPDVSLNEIKKLLQGGIVVPGATLAQNMRMEVK